MTTNGCWTLWRQMPPRYQLTNREPCDDGLDWKNVPLDSRSTVLRRSTNINSNSWVPENEFVKKKLFFSQSVKHSDQNLKGADMSQKQAFPMRKSVYIDNLKQLQKMNSTKQHFVGGPSLISYVPNVKVKSSPQFSVTSLINIALDHNSATDGSQSSGKFFAVENNCNAKFISKGRKKRKNVGESGGTYTTLYMDNNKIFYIGKRKTLDSGGSASALYHAPNRDIERLRREYLSNPKCSDVKALKRERIDYDKKVSHILNYYENGDVRNPNSETSASRAVGHVLPADHKQHGSQADHKQHGSQAASRSRSGHLRSLFSCPENANQNNGNSDDSFEEWRLYLKVSDQKMLHDRQVRTQSAYDRRRVRNIPAGELNMCKCGLCRLEMEMSLASRIPRSFSAVENTRLVCKGQISADEEMSTNHRSEDAEKRQNVSAERTEKEINEHESQNENRNDHSSNGGEKHKDPDFISVTLPDISEENTKGDVNVRVPDNSPRADPVEIPIAEEEQE